MLFVWAEFNDWLLACRVIRIIGPRSSIPLLFMDEDNSDEVVDDDDEDTEE